MTEFALISIVLFLCRNVWSQLLSLQGGIQVQTVVHVQQKFFLKIMMQYVVSCGNAGRHSFRYTTWIIL